MTHCQLQQNLDPGVMQGALLGGYTPLVVFPRRREAPAPQRMNVDRIHPCAKNIVKLSLPHAAEAASSLHRRPR